MNIFKKVSHRLLVNSISSNTIGFFLPLNPAQRGSRSQHVRTISAGLKICTNLPLHTFACLCVRVCVSSRQWYNVYSVCARCRVPAAVGVCIPLLPTCFSHTSQHSVGIGSLSLSLSLCCMTHRHHVITFRHAVCVCVHTFV